MEKCFVYGEKEIEYLKKKDKKLGEVIDTLGHIDRTIDNCDLFSSLMHHIIGQQISNSALVTVWNRLLDKYSPVTAKTIYFANDDDLQGIGISYRKVSYMKLLAKAVYEKEIDLSTLYSLSDEEVIKVLSYFKGIGVWTAEMILLFNMERKDVFSYGDLAIQRGLRMVYHHRKITKEMFEKYRRRYSPYGSVASLYLWAVAGGQIEGMKDYAPKQKK